jgi:precorrin-3B methylase
VLIVGSSRTRILAGPPGRPLVYTPRGYSLGK